MLALKVPNFWKFTSYCSLKPLWSGMGEVVPVRTSPTLHPPSLPTVHQLSRLALKELVCLHKWSCTKDQTCIIHRMNNLNIFSFSSQMVWHSELGMDYTKHKQSEILSFHRYICMSSVMVLQNEFGKDNIRNKQSEILSFLRYICLSSVMVLQNEFGRDNIRSKQSEVLFFFLQYISLWHLWLNG